MACDMCHHSMRLQQGVWKLMTVCRQCSIAALAAGERRVAQHECTSEGSILTGQLLHLAAFGLVMQAQAASTLDEWQQLSRDSAKLLTTAHRAHGVDTKLILEQLLLLHTAIAANAEVSTKPWTLA